MEVKMEVKMDNTFGVPTFVLFNFLFYSPFNFLFNFRPLELPFIFHLSLHLRGDL